MQVSLFVRLCVPTNEIKHYVTAIIGQRRQDHSISFHFAITTVPGCRLGQYNWQTIVRHELARIRANSACVHQQFADHFSVKYEYGERSANTSTFGEYWRTLAEFAVNW
jgi:hypothetical protein